VSAETSDGPPDGKRASDEALPDRLGSAGNLARLVKTIVHGYSATGAARQHFRPYWGIPLQSRHSSTSDMTINPEELSSPLLALIDMRVGRS
jgi:hypothetical protein